MTPSTIHTKRGLRGPGGPTRSASSRAVRRDPLVPANGQPVRDMAAHELCALAIAVFDELLRRAPELDPDMGLAECYHSGRRTLLVRQEAQSWRLAPDRSAAADALLRSAEAVQGAEVIEALTTFPAAVLALLDRRQPIAEPPGVFLRRWTDQPGRDPQPRSRLDD